MTISELRQEYHKRVCNQIIRMTTDKNTGVKYPNFADGSNKSSRMIAAGIVARLGFETSGAPIKEQTVGDLFESATQDFLKQSFTLLQNIRPGNWIYRTDQTAISGFEQYEHLAYLAQLIEKDKALAPTLGGDYIVKPDIIIGRIPLSDTEINKKTKIITAKDSSAKLTALRSINRKEPLPLLHASISCKWTIRSDRSQNTRTEALNLIRNRKGNLPHIVAVTAEPLPTRISALAYGTGDLDCVYHFALTELLDTVAAIDNQDQLDVLKAMIEGRRLRDISDLPFDLAI